MPLKPRCWFVVSISLTLFVFPSMAISSLTLTQTAAPSFGLIVSGASGRQFILNTDDTISGTHSIDYVSGATAGRFIIEDTSSPASVNISVDVLGTTGGLSIGEALCSYGGGIQQTCSGSGITVTSSASATLRLGLELTTSTAHRGGDSATASLELTISYL
ncbi:MAG: hypothetical protein WD448_00670 [Woeseia sp.]